MPTLSAQARPPLRTIQKKMTGDDIKALRRALDLSAKKLAEALGVDQATVLSWEREELFPTKRHVEAMSALAARAATEHDAPDPKNTSKRRETDCDIAQALAEPEVWALFRKLLAHPTLRAEALSLAKKYDDPADD